jgi:PAS domain-containing protein
MSAYRDVRDPKERSAMQDQDKTKEQLIAELDDLRGQLVESKRFEKALHESEERFKLFMDNSPAIAWMKDEQGRYVYVNKSCARRIGVPAVRRGQAGRRDRQKRIRLL